MKRLAVALALFLILTGHAIDSSAQIPRQINFQGVLLDEQGEPVEDGAHELELSLYNVATDGTPLWSETHEVETIGGIFSVVLGSSTELTLDFDEQYWIGTGVDGGEELSPRIALLASPYSIRSASAADGSVTPSALAAGAVTSNALAQGSVTSDALAPGSVTAAAISDGAIPTDKISVSGASNGQVLTVVEGSTAGWREPPDGGGSNDAWSLTGNSGTTNDNFIGTTDNRRFDIRVNNGRALRIVPRDGAPSILAGFAGNSISGGVSGATIAGGGRASEPNEITADYGFVGGGYENQVTSRLSAVIGGNRNQATAENAAVAGGFNNKATGDFSSISAGVSNEAIGIASFVGGGDGNDAVGSWSAVIGGSNNKSEARYSFVGGGTNNEASGDWSFAAGRQAKARHDGTFVWADDRTPEFVSTAGRQFLINAAGGVGIGTNAPATTAHVMRGGTGVTPFALVNDDLIVEDGDAVIGIYSGPSGSYGSGIVLAQLTNGVLTDKWGIARNSTGGGNHLRFSFGTNANYSQNNTVVRFSSVGNVYADGAFYPGGADLAESVGVVGSSDTYEPGHVLAISDAADRTFELSSEPYSTAVTGVYATKPGVLLSEYGIAGPVNTDIPMAVLGIVPTKVTGENGPIRRGDLLVTSSTPGHAMRADPDRLAIGMVLGKALQDFETNGEGVIEVLVNVK